SHGFRSQSCVLTTLTNAIPSHSPELQPAERLWPLVDEPIANRSFENLEQLEELLCASCRSLWEQRELIRGLMSFHWWPQIETSL
ncbi:MAG: hypothetical protein P5680_26470, partial [Limnospira sp. PMC 737.11]|nr:hypothetical protein [Limnospira sp. PMC 737.11]